MYVYYPKRRYFACSYVYACRSLILTTVTPDNNQFLTFSLPKSIIVQFSPILQSKFRLWRLVSPNLNLKIKSVGKELAKVT